MYSFPLRRDSYNGQPSVFQSTISSAESGAEDTPAFPVFSFPPEHAAHPVTGVKQPSLMGFASDVVPLFIHFSTDNDVTGRIREITGCGSSFLNSGEWC